MSSALAPIDLPQSIVIPSEERDLIRRTWAKTLTDLEFEQYIAYSEETGYSIIKRECAAVKFNGVVSYFPTVHGAVNKASRHPAYQGMQTFYCGPDGRWNEIWLDESTPPAACKTIVYRSDRPFPAIGIALWAERKQSYNNNGRETLMPTWAKMPSHMLAKVSKTDALKASGLIGDEQIWYEDVEEIDGAELRVVENRRDTANRRLHGAVAKAGLGGHTEARALAAQVHPGLTSLTDPSLTAAEMHAAADLAQHMDRGYVEALIAGEQSLADTAAETTSESVDDDRAIWRDQIQTALAGDYKALAKDLLAYARLEPWRFLDLIELAPSERYVSGYRTAAITAGVNAQDLQRSLAKFADRKQIRAAAEESNQPAAASVKTWDDLWKLFRSGGVDSDQFEAMTGRKATSYGSPQEAYEAYCRAEASIPDAQPVAADPEPDDFAGEPVNQQLFDSNDPDRFTR